MQIGVWFLRISVFFFFFFFLGGGGVGVQEFDEGGSHRSPDRLKCALARKLHEFCGGSLRLELCGLNPIEL